MPTYYRYQDTDYASIQALRKAIKNVSLPAKPTTGMLAELGVEVIDSPYQCVIGSDKYFITYTTPQAYVLNDGESFIDAENPVDYLKPWWNGNKWKEGAKNDELSAREAEKATAALTIEDRITAIEERLIILEQTGVN